MGKRKNPCRHYRRWTLFHEYARRYKYKWSLEQRVCDSCVHYLIGICGRTDDYASPFPVRKCKNFRRIKN